MTPPDLATPPSAARERLGDSPRSTPRWRRFSLRGLLLLTTLLCILLGVWAAFIEPYRSQWAVVATIADLKGEYKTQLAPGSAWQRWLVTTVLGQDKFVRVTTVNLQRTSANDETLAAIASLAELRELNLDHTKVTNRGLASLRRLPKLRLLSLRYCQIDDEGLAAALDALPLEMQCLALTGTRVTDASAPRFERRAIADLYIRWTDVTPAGARRIAELMRRGAVHHHAGKLPAAGPE